MLKYYNIWVVFTLLVFYLGPINWSQQQNYVIAILVLACLFFFNLGVGFGNRLPSLPAHNFRALNSQKIAIGVIVVFILLSQIHTKSVTGLSILNPFNYSLQFGEVYSNFQDTLKGRHVSVGSLEGVALILKAVILPYIIILLVLNFKKSKLLLLLILFPFAASGMMRGTDKEGIDIAIYLLVLAFYHKILGRNALIALGIFALIIVLFMERKLARFGVNLPSCLPGVPEACFDFDNFLSNYVSNSAEFLRLLLSSYITQGYEGLGRALRIPFEFNFGLGHMQTIQDKLCQVLKVSCDLQTFGDKLPDYGWNTKFKWKSVYTVLANDFYWLFTPVYFFILGVIFRVSERSWYNNKDMLSLTALLLVTLFFVYSSANMQLTISLGWTIVYLSIFCTQIIRILRNKPRLIS